jgi:hypothetical protein
MKDVYGMLQLSQPYSFLCDLLLHGLHSVGCCPPSRHDFLLEPEALIFLTEECDMNFRLHARNQVLQLEIKDCNDQQQDSDKEIEATIVEELAYS